MTDLNRALAEIDAIRGQIARAAEFRGYGPATVAASGFLGIAVAGVQGLLIKSPMHASGEYLTLWIGTAVVAVTLTGVEMIARTRRIYSRLALEMMHSAVDRFVPPLLAGLLLTAVLVHSAPHCLWMLPGLWQVLFSLGIFSSCKLLPRPMFAAGLWYLITGLACLAAGGGDASLSPWAMGLPFGLGQLLVAAVLQFGYRDANERT
ncbi:MAG TPA: hypothetical protein VIY54_05595 [Steroidobacteraceae bacterium]